MSFRRQARWTVSQLGRKPGRRSSEALLFAVTDLVELAGGAWKQLDERTWRTGEADRDAGWAQRARDVGSITAWRSFENKGGSRWLWCQAVPLASAEDVVAAALEVADNALPNRGAKVKLVASRELDPPDLSPAVFLFGREQETTGSKGTAFSYLLGFGVGPVLAIVALSGAAATFDDALMIAEALSQRIRDRLEPDDSDPRGSGHGRGGENLS